MFNPFNLGSDMMEPFRILIDRKVYYMKPQVFEHNEKMQMLDILNKEIWMGDKREVVSNAIKIYCKSIFDALGEKDISLIKFYRNEL